MDSRHVAHLVEYGFMLLAGIYCTALGHRWVGKPPGESQKYDVWHQKYGTRLKWLGPLVAIFAVALYIMSRMRPSP